MHVGERVCECVCMWVVSFRFLLHSEGLCALEFRFYANIKYA